MSCILIAQGRIGNVKKVLTSTGITIVNLSVASDNAEKDKDGQFKTEWTDFEAFGKRADGIFNYFHKGDMVCIYAKKSTTKAVDHEGKTRYYTHYKIENIEMLSRNKKTTTDAEEVSDSEVAEAINNIDEDSIPDIDVAEQEHEENKVPLKDAMDEDIPY